MVILVSVFFIFLFASCDTQQASSDYSVELVSPQSVKANKTVFERTPALKWEYQKDGKKVTEEENNQAIIRTFLYKMKHNSRSALIMQVHNKEEYTPSVPLEHGEYEIRFFVQKDGKIQLYEKRFLVLY